MTAGASDKSISESGISAIRFNSRRCFSVRGRVNSSFASNRLSCRDDADPFFVIVFDYRVGHNKDRKSAGPADDVPAFLAFHDAFREHHRIRIVEDLRCGLEGDSVLYLV